MSHSPISYHVDLLPSGAPKRNIDIAFSDEETDSDSADDDHGSQYIDISRFIGDEIDLEVAIRERLVTTIEGRIKWALHMLDALSNVNESHDQHLDADDFQDAALDALEALEAPSSFLFDNGYPEERSPSPSFSPIVPNPPAPQRVPKTRSSRTPKPSQQKKHLYIKIPLGTTDSQVAVLACPTCGRTQFTNLQGLLNHARLAHGVEWASHDACITACASPIPAETQGWETCERDGVEVPLGGSVAGLRRLFERAVGVDGVSLNALSAYKPLDAPFPGTLAPTPSTLLSRTLGLHADSAALAQFLGRAPKRRCIHVYGEDQDADIMTLDSTTPLRDKPPSEELVPSKKSFHMHYPHRNIAREEFDLQVSVDKKVEIANTGDTTHAIVPTGASASRFHITARIRLEDRSLFLKEDRRAQLGTTDRYRWMLGVTAPSYSLPLSSFLTCVMVVPPRTVSPVFLTVQQPPFAVIGTANGPFMAKVILEWVGGGKMEVEHWVELDQSRSSTSVSGSEQLLDIELDRNVPLLPISKGNSLPLPSLDRQLLSDSPFSNTEIDRDHGDVTTKEEYYEQVLRNLLPKVPMTMKDVKQRSTVQVPYKLVANSAQLLGLVLGRRKAIEWARARALHALYVDHMASVPPSRRTSLSIGDVYMFLEDTLQFPRPSYPTSGSVTEGKKKRKEKEGTPTLSEGSCPTCGIKRRFHPGYEVKTEEEAGGWVCGVVPTEGQRYGTRFPLTNLVKAFAWPDGLEQAIQGPPLPPNLVLVQALPPYQHAPRDLLMHNPPELTLAVQRIISRLHLPAFPALTSRGGMPTFLAKREEAERSLVPAALLTVTLKPFISALLRSAIEIAKRDVTSIVPAAKDGRGKKIKKLTFVLTPAHILRGLRLQPLNSFKATPHAARTTSGSDTRVKEFIALCLARLGVPLDFGKDVSAALAMGNPTEPGPTTERGHRVVAL